MGKIKHLSEKTINQIAAGEVVERPSSIVKELVENSIDAGAENIFVETDSGGKKRIAVKDNGCGMSEDDVYMSLERHATSKLTNISGLNNLVTMGFRGEAIPSIAAVTDFSIASALSNGEGFKIVIKNGIIIENCPTSMPKGTEIICANLFHNIPARKKFLKSDEREFSHIKEIIKKFSIINYKTVFSFTNNSKNVFFVNSAPNIIQRVADVWNIKKENIGDFLIEKNNISVRSIVPSPAESPVSLSVVAVNGRIVNDRTVNGIILRTFRELLGGEFRSPVVVLIEVERDDVDVNVHPSKLEVRFRNTYLISELITESIEKALKSLRGDLEIQKNELVFLENNISLNSFPQNRNDFFVSEKNSNREYSGELFNFNTDNLYGIKFKNYKKLGVLFGVYQIIEMSDRVIFLDQHAAHERITFTILKKSSEIKSGLSQMLISPVIVVLSSLQLNLIKENISLFNNAGFMIEEFDQNSIAIRAVPALGFDADWNGIIKEMAGQISELDSSRLIDEIFLSKLATTACRNSVKRNDFLTDTEIDSLIEDINKSDVLTCPHGRPFFFSISKNEFEKKVQRQ